MIKFFLLVTNQGQPRIRKYYGYPDEELQFEPELIKKCLTRNEHLVLYEQLIMTCLWAISLFRNPDLDT